ncbi:hypothetical protein LSAT2_016726 [Lamellibrachia satsuma]|nr:hypothetical protein LSAT2_016726 [Lamellibrachia satsuma]
MTSTFLVSVALICLACPSATGWLFGKKSLDLELCLELCKTFYLRCLRRGLEKCPGKPSIKDRIANIKEHLTPTVRPALNAERRETPIERRIRPYQNHDVNFSS